MSRKEINNLPIMAHKDLLIDLKIFLQYFNYFSEYFNRNKNRLRYFLFSAQRLHCQFRTSQPIENMFISLFELKLMTITRK